MKLLINPAGGMAGDMFSAALISAGADFGAMREAMTAAAAQLGAAKIDLNTTEDGSSQLSIQLDSDRHHLEAGEAVEILGEMFRRFDLGAPYRELGIKALDILLKAEKVAHQRFNIVVEGDHSHPHPHHHDHRSHSHAPDGEHTHEHHHPHKYEGTFLHEAQDIVIDIMGAVTGLQLLGIEPSADLACPVSVGGGHVYCSHGTLPVPAPATTIIMEDHHIPWIAGPLDRELFTPTGAALLAALGARIHPGPTVEQLDVIATGKARGSKVLEIPPLILTVYKI